MGGSSASILQQPFQQTPHVSPNREGEQSNLQLLKSCHCSMSGLPEPRPETQHCCKTLTFHITALHTKSLQVAFLSTLLVVSIITRACMTTALTAFKKISWHMKTMYNVAVGLCCYQATISSSPEIFQHFGANFCVSDK